jgi:AraC family transcriptional regulator
VLRAALADRDPAAAEAERPIRFTHAPADAPTYLAQRRLFVDAVNAVDPLAVEERVVSLLERVLALAYNDRRAAGECPPRTADLAEAAKRWIAPRLSQRLTLTSIATALGCSVFHLCRSFRRATGLTLHGYRDDVRLRIALERLDAGERDLTRLALDLGYSSHSHFSDAFRRSFGVTPSIARKLLIVRS